MRLVALYVCILLFGALSCEKSPSEPAFRINAARDVDIMAGLTKSLPIEIVPVSGTQELVTLEIEELPSGVSAKTTTNNQTPPFQGDVIFYAEAAAKPGDYPINIISSSPSSARMEHKLVLKVTQANYWKIRDTIYLPTTVTRHTTMHGHAISANINESIPSVTILFASVPTSGNYKIVNGSPSHENEIGIVSTVEPHTYFSLGDDNKTADVTVTNGKITVTASEVNTYSIGYYPLIKSKISVNITEQ